MNLKMFYNLCNDNDNTLKGTYDMTTITNLQAKRDTLNLRIKTHERILIDRAAKIQGKNLTTFVLDALRSASEQAILDQTYISTNPKAFEEFVNRLDAPAQTNENLRKTMQKKAPWDN